MVVDEVYGNIGIVNKGVISLYIIPFFYFYELHTWSLVQNVEYTYPVNTDNLREYLQSLSNLIDKILYNFYGVYEIEFFIFTWMLWIVAMFQLQWGITNLP